MANVKIDELADAIMKELTEYNQEVTDGLKKDIRIVAKECAKEIKMNSPKDTGEYAKSWGTKVLYEGTDDIRISVYNKKHYQLTHLLEYGHAKVNGGRVSGKPHIRPAEEHAEQNLMKKVRAVVKG